MGNSDLLHYYSLVGNRAIPVCMPLYQYLKGNPDLRADATLVCTEGSRDVAGVSEEFFRKEFGERVSVDVVSYDRFMTDLKAGAVQSDGVINLSPGMNWQVSEVVLNLPEGFQCVNLDYRYIYRYPLDTGIEDADRMEMRYDLGFENYNMLNPEVEVQRDETPHMNPAFHEISGDCHFKLKLRKYHPYISWINYSLLYVQERRGFLYLLFDITERGLHQHLKGMKRENQSLVLYRLINSTFEQVNYSVTVISDNRLFKERASYDGICIIEDKKPAMERWLKNPPEPKKTPMKGKGEMSLPRIRSKMKRVLLLSLGDNILPTLKAIKSHREIHNTDTTIVFYDEDSERLRSIAEKMKGRFIYYGKLELLPTDHMGRGVLEKMKAICREQGVEWFVNITPGTKAQTVALSAGASMLGLADRVFSLKKVSLCEVRTGKEVGRVYDVSPDEVIDFYCFDYEGKEGALSVNVEENKELWDDILQGFAAGKYEYRGGGLKGICIKGNRPVLSGFEFDRSGYTLYHEGMKKSFSLPAEVFKREKDLEEGWWWELTTFRAITKHEISDRVMLNILCYSSHKHKTMSEIDLAFTYRGYIVAVSCKTYKDNIKLHAYQLLAEARNRFGRMAVCMLALPHNNSDEYVGIDEKGEKVFILNPGILSSKDKLVETIEKQISLLSTTN
ncbi:MAG: hypothetical protein D6726_11535 [Nitrospirae bacterium]|nr:MAG: hypothetical protein D6726_11535 [Nitrospirota bacterium]